MALTNYDRYLAYLASDPALTRNLKGNTYTLVTEPQAALAIALETQGQRCDAGISSDDVRIGLLVQDPYTTLLRDAVRFPDGSPGLYNRVIVPPGVVVLPILGNSVVMIRQFRHATRDWRLEIPRGISDGPPHIERDVRRELQEEIGADTERVIEMGPIYTSTGMTSEIMYLAVAHIRNTGSPGPEETISDVVRMPITEFEQGIGDGTIADGLALATFARARVRGLI